MRRITRTERAAALAVAAAAAAVAGAGFKLMKKHTAFIVQKAAAFFKNDAEVQELDEAIREEAAQAEQSGTDVNDMKDADEEQA